jgi:formamidopyrimidine-DNA glycosylase
VPELPEVQALTEILDRRLRGRRIAAVVISSVAALKTYDPPISALTGLEVSGVSRRGKFLDFEAPPLHLVIHLSRGGWIRWRDATEDRRLAQRGPLAARVRLEDGAGLDITEHGKEKRLAMYVVRDPGDVPGVSRLGVDALDDNFDHKQFAALLRSQRGTLKSVLSDQRLLAGVGNAYSDEILHVARLSPFAHADHLDDAALEHLWVSMRGVLLDALDRARQVDMTELKDDKRSGMRVHGRTGLPCPVCGDTVREVSLASRSFQYCPTCQTGGRIYADRRLSKLLR